MLPLTPERAQKIIDDPAFKQLASARARLRWGLSAVTLIMFFGFIALISTAGNALKADVSGSSVPLGLLLAVTVIVLVVLLTGYYVMRSNTSFDELSRRLSRELAR
jgi:uncharacterized membrane protein (DUF485 family)